MFSLEVLLNTMWRSHDDFIKHIHNIIKTLLIKIVKRKCLIKKKQ